MKNSALLVKEVAAVVLKISWMVWALGCLLIRLMLPFVLVIDSTLMLVVSYLSFSMFFKFSRIILFWHLFHALLLLNEVFFSLVN